MHAGNPRVFFGVVLQQVRAMVMHNSAQDSGSYNRIEESRISRAPCLWRRRSQRLTEAENKAEADQGMYERGESPRPQHQSQGRWQCTTFCGILLRYRTTP